MNVLTVVGNRPQFIKAAAVSTALRKVADEVLVHTGQHYDHELSGVFFDQLPIPAADYNLGVGHLRYEEQLTGIISGITELATGLQPDLMLVYGDTNSTLAAALAAKKLRVPLAHVEAGMRSFDLSMPEEVNRILTDHIASSLLCPSSIAAENLKREGVTRDVEVVGDVMLDIALTVAAKPDKDLLAGFGLISGQYILITAHRAGNVDDRDQLSRLVGLVESVPCKAIFPLHPRTRERLQRYSLYDRLSFCPAVELIEPVGYRQLLTLLSSARAVATDSGGMQKEAYLFAVPCITLRESTEWVETVELGWNQLVGLDSRTFLDALAVQPPRDRPTLYGGGKAVDNVVKAINSFKG